MYNNYVTNTSSSLSLKIYILLRLPPCTDILYIHLHTIQTFVSALDIERMKTLCLRLLEGRGGLSLAQSLLEEPPESSPPTTEVPWCTCGKCHIMPQAVENLCCGRSTCITTYEIFYTICLHPVNLRVALENSADYRADEVICSNRNLRKTAYRQFILWAHGKLGRQNRRVVPSCVVQAIRHHYPSPTGLYMGYREH